MCHCVCVHCVSTCLFWLSQLQELQEDVMLRATVLKKVAEKMVCVVCVYCVTTHGCLVFLAFTAPEEERNAGRYSFTGRCSFKCFSEEGDSKPAGVCVCVTCALCNHM